MKKSIALLLCASAAFAKPVHAPLPPEAYSAKTIAVVNHSGTQKVADKAYEELQKWARFTVVQNPDSADMVLVVEVNVHSVGATASNYGSTTTTVTENRVADITTAFILKGQKEPFFTETERANIFRKSATQRGIDDLKKRLDEGSGS